MSPTFGMLADRYSSRLLTSAWAAVVAAGFFAMGNARELGQFLLGYVVTRSVVEWRPQAVK